MSRVRRTSEPSFAGGSDDDFLVYGDQLVQRGDPRGELIHVQHALAKKPKERKLRAAQAKLFADHPELAPPAKPRDKNVMFRQKLTWRLGFVDVAQVKRATPEMFEALVDHPSARFLRRLEVEIGGFRAPTIVLQLARTPRPALRELVLIEKDDGYGAQAPTYDTERGHAHRKGDALWRALPSLEVLELRAFRLFHSLTSPTLRKLVAIGYPFCSEPWVAPQLAELTWRVGRKEHLETSVRSGDVDVLDTALASDLPALRRIDLKDCEVANDYTGLERESFAVTFGRVRRTFDVVMPQP
jgi:hypothetical protein